MKGVTPVIVIVLLLGIAVAIGGSAYIFLTGYSGSLTSSAFEVISSMCEQGEAVINIKNVGTEPIMISSLPNKIQAAEYKPDANTVLLLHFNEGSGSSVVDSSQSSIQATRGALGDCDTQVDCPAWELQGKFGSALNHDGIDDIVTTASHAGLDFTGKSFTLEAWMKATSPTIEARQLFTRLGVGSGYALSTAIGGYVLFGINDVSVDNIVLSPGNRVDVNKWYHIMATYDATTREITIYVNGTQEGTKTVENPYSDPLVIGLQTGSPLSRWQGVIDEIRLSDTLRNPSTSLKSWGYPCQVTGEKSTCGDFFVTRTISSEPDQFQPYFDVDVINPGQLGVLRDGGCNGFCKYRLSAGARQSPEIGVTC